MVRSQSRSRSAGSRFGWSGGAASATQLLAMLAGHLIPGARASIEVPAVGGWMSNTLAGEPVEVRLPDDCASSVMSHPPDGVTISPAAYHPEASSPIAYGWVCQLLVWLLAEGLPRERGSHPDQMARHS